jgi:septal ring factor EnvC (AmiA/AmiB activator)
MSRPLRSDEGEPSAAPGSERAAYARGEIDRTEQELERLRARSAELQRQIDVVNAENEHLERELVQKLTTWRKLDDANLRVDEVLPQLRAITGSLCYRICRVLLHGVNRVLGVVTLRFLRR